MATVARMTHDPETPRIRREAKGRGSHQQGSPPLPEAILRPLDLPTLNTLHAEQPTS